MELQHFSSMTFIKNGKYMYQLPVLFVLHDISCFEEWGRGLNTMSQILYCSVINNLWASNTLSARHTDKTNTRSIIHQTKKYITRNGQNALGYRYRSICSWFRCVAWVLSELSEVKTKTCQYKPLRFLKTRYIVS